MGWPVSEPTKHTKRETTTLDMNSDEYKWHEKNLEVIRARATGNEDTPHFIDQARKRGVSDYLVEKLRYNGVLIAIDIGMDHPGDWLPKYHLSLHENGVEYVGVFATDGLELYGITVMVNRNPQDMPQIGRASCRERV